MAHPPLVLLNAIAALTEALPEGAIHPLAEALAAVPAGAWATLHGAATHVLAAPQYREQVGAFVTAWQAHAPTVPPAAVALAIQAAATTLSRERRAQTIEVVWTGPASRQPLRRTAQVLQGIIDEARQELLIVAFAVYAIPEIGAALLRAAQRGVQIRLVIESPQASAGKIAYDSLAAFGPQVATHAEVYCWPLEQRRRDDEGRYGSLHAKCAVADRELLLISSANLTHYALSLNMELGLLVRGGPQPREVDRHFRALIDQGALTLLPTQSAEQEQAYLLVVAKETLAISDAQYGAIERFVKELRRIRLRGLDDNMAAEIAKNAAAGLTAVGVPIAAVYMSGSVIGLSAAGITSGLAAVGLGLGMVPGIGMAVLLGTGIFLGVRWLLDAGQEREKERLRAEAMRKAQLVIQNLQEAINLLIERIQELKGAAADAEANHEAIIRLSERLRSLQQIIARRKETVEALR